MGRIKSNLTVIYADSRKRDSTVALLIGEYLNRKKQECFIASQRNFSKILKLITPANIIIIGQINILFDLIYDGHDLKREFKGMNIYFYPAEGYATESFYHIIYPNIYNYKDINKIFFWGKENLNWVRDNVKVKPAVLDNTGYPRLKMAKVYAEIRNGKYKHRIGMVGRFPLLNNIYGDLPMKYLLGEFTEGKPYLATHVARLESEGRTIPTMLKTIEIILEETDFVLSIRPHPNEDKRTYKVFKDFFGARVEISEEVDVADWMASCEKIVSIASSSYVDASLVDIPVICLDKLSDTHEETLHFNPGLELIYDVAYLPETFEELKFLILENIEKKPSIIFDKLMKTNFIGDYEDPLSHVADSIEIKKCGIFDRLIKIGIDVMDFLLIGPTWIWRRTSLDFDYSAFIHGKDQIFIDKYISDNSKGKVFWDNY